MRSVESLAVALSLTSYAFAWTGGHRDLPRGPQKRNIVSNGQIQAEYDFVIAGGGTAGLVLASRLTEDPNLSVLVLEAGDTGDAVANSINIPGNAYYDSLYGTSYDWAYQTVPQPYAGNRPLTWARGKVLGGSSAMNGLYIVRPSEVEVNTWSELIATQDPGIANAWNWENMLAAMKKSETFTAPPAAIQQAGDITYDTSSRGTDGPVQVSYPGYMFPVVGNWTPALTAMDIPASPDAYGGNGWGSFVATSSINPSNFTRSYSRSAYIDPLPPRSNLDILPNAAVTRLIFSNATTTNLTATAVEFGATAAAARQTVNVRKEVILAGGAIGSPNILLHSGVGPEDVLQAAGVAVNVALPGVGQHLQDHLSTEVTFQTTEATAASMHASNSATANTPAFLSFVNSATVYVNISELIADPATFAQQIAGNLTYASTLVPSIYPEVVAGYQAIYNATLNNVFMSPVGQMEILLALTGTGVGAQTIAIQAAHQHPFSHGRVYINSSDPFASPVIDPGYLSHPADIVILREGLKLARTLGGTPPLSAAMGVEASPGPTVQSDADWENWLVTTVGTEFHPSCSCAMLPQNLGGVVDANLKVYGLANVRVVDASVFPMQFSAHLQAPVYALAEQASTIIRSFYNGSAVPWSSSTTTSAAPGATATGQSTTKNGAQSRYASATGLAAIAGAAMAAVIAMVI
ncbi:GMC oxidoreductase [Jaapia argillacea MUCL 33604]|uniref:GMC oxidoreductase n=1 Tax=Jaapia argillacea MUCL 33604 TaxID=933084 RepID=A0A067PQZ5_9AGAM|nr:GMC oxidoreductase [Jaapia argillacea MUCL 33604]